MSVPSATDPASPIQWHDRFVRELPADPDTDNESRQVAGAAYSRADPTPVAAPRMVAWSPEAAAQVGLCDAHLKRSDWLEVLAGNRVMPGMKPYAACYGGHQFGNWAGQLGDGRAITLGELVGVDGRHFELQLKGAGPTPYSRMADGRAVLRSSVREFLCSEAMHHLGVPTTRALSLVRTGDGVMRDMLYDGRPAEEPGAIVCRTAPTFLRFGSYQIHMARSDEDTLQALVAYTVRHHFPSLLSEPDAPIDADVVHALFAEVCRRTAVMVAHWMRVGFVHGVMNTDNMSILGLTIDYGPYGWIDHYDPEWTPNLTDASRRRYRYGHQPNVAGWNLIKLAEAFFPLVGVADGLSRGLDVYRDTWYAEQQGMVAGKLGLLDYRPETDAPLWSDLLDAMQLVETDMTLLFRGLADVSSAVMAPSDRLAALRPAFYMALTPQHEAAWSAWLERYVARVAVDGRDDAERRAAMHSVNPLYVLRNWLAQEAIEQAERGDSTRVQALLDVVRDPYTERPGLEHFAGKRPEWARHKAGCSMLSCSS
ncbi:MAG: hypothetical protein CL927_00480 [Deltaproteobacteria bacterium]|nr:hypothetical protein [Deltaproteobacteria bacterium]HCH64483.1 YdiU family protein [Deltaproteobacteria bacterium]